VRYSHLPNAQSFKAVHAVLYNLKRIYSPKAGRKALKENFVNILGTGFV
jgi:hypothetical protein